jgi:hypothetical protein
MRHRLVALLTSVALSFSFAAVLPTVASAANYQCKTAYPAYQYWSPSGQYAFQLKVVGCYDAGSEVWGQSISVYSGTPPSGYSKGYTSGSSVTFYLNGGPASARKTMNIYGNFSACYDQFAGGSGGRTGNWNFTCQG